MVEDVDGASCGSWGRDGENGELVFAGKINFLSIYLTVSHVVPYILL